jgi:hypothetical protein
MESASSDEKQIIPSIEIQNFELLQLVQIKCKLTYTKQKDDVPLITENEDKTNEQISSKNPVLNNETINFQHVLMPVEEAREFFVSHTETFVKSKLLQTTERTQDIKIHLHKKILEGI